MKMMLLRLSLLMAFTVPALSQDLSASSPAPLPPAGGGVVQSCGPDNYTYCYGNGWDSTVTYQSVNSFPIAVLFNGGGMEPCCDNITVYDGLTTASPLLYSGNNGGNLTGLFFASTNPDHALTIVFHSDLSINCSDGTWGYAPLDWTVSCLDCSAPAATFGVDLDCTNNLFYATVNITTMGTDPAADITNNAGAPALTATAPGVYTVGPFALGTSVVVTVENDLNALCNVVSPVLTNGPCPVISCGPDNYIHCYNDNWDSTTVYQSANTYPIAILFNSGNMENCCDNITVHDGLNALAPVIYQGNGNFGDLTGLFFSSTNADNALTVVWHSDASVNCAGGFGYQPLDWTVSCLDCTNPEATFNVVPDCVQHAFFVDVNVSNTGTSSTVRIADSYSGDTLVNIGTGVTTIGPIPFDSTAVITVLNATNPLCRIFSPSFTYSADSCVIQACEASQFEHCYSDGDTAWFVYESGTGQPITIHFLAGQLLVGDYIQVFNGYDTQAAILFQGNVGGDLSGFSISSQNADNALTLRVVSSPSGSCAGGQAFPPLLWAVSCGLVGVEEVGADALRLYPNPSNGIIHIAGLDAPSGLMTVEVMDALGRTVRALAVPFTGGGQATMDLGDLENGNYIVRMSSPRWVSTRQLQVAR